MEIRVRNVNEAVSEGLRWLAVAGVKENSRNGPVIVSPEPVMTIYTNPWERILFSPLRDQNCFFTFFEGLWMLAGRNDVAWPVYFNSKFGQFSDDGETFHGAYGYRWRKMCDIDQLKVIIQELKDNPDSRRCVLQMWNANGMRDLSYAVQGGKDVPCNTHAYFDARGGRVNMTVCCRSNDMILGGYGANAVHFSMLLEYVAASAGMPVGEYRQFSNNYHVYESALGKFCPFCGNRLEEEKKFELPQNKKYSLEELAEDAHRTNYYETEEGVAPFRIMSSTMVEWDRDLYNFMCNPEKEQKYCNVFFSNVARPMYLAWKERKEKRGTGLGHAGRILASDWRRACTEWITRRESKNAKKEGS